MPNKYQSYLVSPGSIPIRIASEFLEQTASVNHSRKEDILAFENYKLTSAVNIMNVFLYILFFFNDVTIFPTASSKAVTIAAILIKLSKLFKIKIALKSLVASFFPFYVPSLIFMFEFCVQSIG